MIQFAKMAFGKEQDTAGAVGRALRRPDYSIGHCFEVPGESVSRLAIVPRHLVEVVNFKGLRPRGLRHGAKDVGKAVLGRCLAFFGPVG